MIAGVASRFGDRARRRRDAAHVEDQRDPAVAEDGRAGVRRHVAQPLADRLDDDLFAVVDGVDDEAERAAFVLQHDDRRAGARVATEHLVEIDQRQQLAAQPVDRCAVDEFERAVNPARARTPTCAIA